MRLKWAGATAIALIIVGTSPAFSQSLTFRGLGSSSTRANVLKTFPQAQPQNYCRNGETVARSAEGLSLCAVLLVKGYSLDNDSFDVTFAFNPDGSLRYVALFKLIGSFQNDDGIAPAATIRSVFSSLADLLSSKYGPAVANPPGAYLTKGPADSALEWQPGRGTEWKSGGDRISLKSGGIESKAKPGLFHGSVQIFYRFERRAELDKL